MPIIVSSELIRSEMKTALFWFPGLDVFPILNVATAKPGPQMPYCQRRSVQWQACTRHPENTAGQGYWPRRSSTIADFIHLFLLEIEPVPV